MHLKFVLFCGATNEANINIQQLAVNLNVVIDISSIECVGLGTVTATANKLSKIRWNMLIEKQPYKPLEPVLNLDKIRSNEVKNIQRNIQPLNIKEEEINFVVD